MSGIYIHIPFCRQACHYCDFHFSTTLKHKDVMTEALLHEIELRKNYLGDETVNTLYFGGGSPSLMDVKELEAIIQKVNQHFETSHSIEVTLEANPDDLNKNYLKSLKNIGINRLSIGVQSFIDRDLAWMNRIHSATDALDSIKRAQDIGLENISIDLIYGTPGLKDEEWKQNIHRTFELGIQHISSYALTVESNTALGSWVKKGTVKPMDEEQAANQFEILMDEMASENFIHYEISNFCKEGFESKHNSSYWSGKKYLGIGPSAHSFNKTSRQWNIANNHQYMDNILSGKLPYEEEILSLENRINEYIMISIRTKKGISIDYFETEFGSEMLSLLRENVKKYIQTDILIESDGFIFCTKKGKLLADKISSELFIIKDHDH